MRKLLLLSAFCIGLFFFICGNGYAASKDQDVDRNEVAHLREKCRISAEKYFTGRFGSGIRYDDFGQRIDTYTNHYNEKLNKCFILIETVVIPNYKIFRTSRAKTLLEIYKDTYYGSYGIARDGSVNPCEMLKKECHSEEEWYALVKPYTEE
jgi:hypothetical protein